MNSEDSKLLDEVKDTLDAITALKNGEPTKVAEAEVEAEEESTEETVEETKDAKEEVTTKEAEEATEEVVEEAADEAEAVEETEEAKEESEEAEESTEEDKEDEEAAEEEAEKSVKEEVTTKFASASDVGKVLEAVKELTSFVSTLSEDVEALKNAKTSRKGVMPENEVEEEVQDDESAKLKKQVDYVFGK